MLKIDSHQHFWLFDPLRDSWITDDMSILQQDFLPEDLKPELIKSGFQSCIAIQADQSEKETEFLLNLADQHDFIQGVVGWVDLQAENIEERLNYYSQFSKLKGFRHLIQAEPDIDFMLGDNFKRGIAALNIHGFTYDLLIYPQHLSNAIKLVKDFPEQTFVIDHMAKPNIKNQEIKNWIKDMQILAENENVYCKVSGMVTEADWKNWKNEDFKIYIDTVFEAFGRKRIMFGSDWPVCKLAAEHPQVCAILENHLMGFSENEQTLFWSGNARKFYKL